MTTESLSRPNLHARGPIETMWTDRRATVLAVYLQLLLRDESPLLTAGEAVLDQVKAQLLGVVDSVAAVIDPPSPSTCSEDGGRSLSESIGRTRANAAIHASQSLHAASLIFEAALPTIADRLADRGDPTPELTAGVLLNREILQRMAVAARSYVDYLLEKAHDSNRDERRRLSREMHDVAAPAVAIGLQNLELYEAYAGRDPERAALKLDAARQAMLDALTTIRNLSAESRESVATSGLAAATKRYLATVPTDIRTDLTLDGDLAVLSLAATEELFLVIREAIRNAAEHANPQSIHVALEADGITVRAQVTDDGVGFDVARASGEPTSVGMASMRERAELLGAELVITSSPGHGSTVAIKVPLPKISCTVRAEAHRS